MKPKTFDQFWKEIQSRLTPRPRLYAWSAAGKAKSWFGVTRVVGEGITVLTTKGKRNVPRRDFESLFPLWEDYVRGKIQRQTLRDLSVNSTYVISVLHWLEIQPGVGEAQ